MLDRSPLHAWHSHPRLNPNFEPRAASSTLDLGSVAHRVLLENSWAGVAICEEDSWRKKVAKDFKDAAREGGQIPILRKQFDQIEAMVEAAVDSDLFHPALGRRIEKTVAWQEGDVWCRVKPDILPADPPLIWDYKTTSTAATPESWGRTLLPGYLMQAGLYTRGIKRVLGWKDCEMRFIVQETERPYALAVFSWPMTTANSLTGSQARRSSCGLSV